jgi:hypothetical protein
MKPLRPIEINVARITMVLGSALVITLMWLCAAREMTPVHAIRSIPEYSKMVVEPKATSIYTIYVATDGDYWPFTYYSGTQIIGHDIDLMDAIAAEINASVVYSNVTWSEIFTGLIAGDYDVIISGVSFTPDREEILDFTLPYMTYDDGSDKIAIAVQQGNHDLRRQFNEALWQLREDGSLQSIISGVASDLPDSNARLPEWPIILTDTDTTLSYPSSDGTYTTSVRIPSEAVSDSVVLAYSTVDTPTVPANFTFVGGAFNLDVYQDGTYVEGFVFNQPITLTLNYNEEEINNSEQWLTLNLWDPEHNQWVDAATTCDPESIYQRIPDIDQLSIAICHLSEFALLEQVEFYLQLPFILRVP